MGRKRRASSSSLSEAADDDEEEEDDDDEDEDRPLASRISANTTSRSVAGKRNGKSAPGKKAKKSQAARTSSAHLAGGEELALVNGKINGSHKARIKIEDRMDENQLSRLAAGVPMDAVGRSTANVSAILQVFIPPLHLYLEASYTDRETVCHRAAQGCDTDHSGRERYVASVPCYLDRPENPFSKTITENASRIYCSSRLRCKFQGLGHHKAWV